MNDPSVLDDVFAALSAHGVDVRVVGRPPRGGGDVALVLEWRGHTHEYVAEVADRTTAATVSRIAATLPRKALLVAPHVPPPVAMACREHGVHFADTAGNVFLDWGDLLLDVEGRRPQRGPAARADRRLRAFQPSGLRIVFALLCRPDLAAAPYRAISEAAGVSVGSVHLVVKELADNGWVEERGGRVLHRTRELFDRWADGYVLNLDRRLVLGHYNTGDPRPWLAGRIDVAEFGGQWGGENAAAILGTNLRPANAIVYLPVLPDDVLRRHRLRRTVPGGTIVFRERFWRFDGDRDVVPVPLVYADLVASGDPRQVEAARELRERDDDLRRIDAR